MLANKDEIRISVALVTRNRPESLERCLKSLRSQNVQPKVLQDLNLPPCDWIDIIPQYDSEELPMLLSGATVGAFPSYIEGFPFAVLEQLASGLPTVAYDVPGPRETLRLLDDSLLIPVGNIEQFANKLVSLLHLDLESYTYLSNKCLDIGSNFSWQKIAKQTLEVYYNFLERQK